MDSKLCVFRGQPFVVIDESMVAFKVVFGSEAVLELVAAGRDKYVDGGSIGEIVGVEQGRQTVDKILDERAGLVDQPIR